MSAERFVVRCIDHTTGVIVTRAAAERRLAMIVASRRCALPHRVIQVPEVRSA